MCVYIVITRFFHTFRTGSPRRIFASDISSGVRVSADAVCGKGRSLSRQQQCARHHCAILSRKLRRPSDRPPRTVVPRRRLRAAVSCFCVFLSPPLSVSLSLSLRRRIGPFQSTTTSAPASAVFSSSFIPYEAIYRERCQCVNKVVSSYMSYECQLGRQTKSSVCPSVVREQDRGNACCAERGNCLYGSLGQLSFGLIDRVRTSLFLPSFLIEVQSLRIVAFWGFMSAE